LYQEDISRTAQKSGRSAGDFWQALSANKRHFEKDARPSIGAVASNFGVIPQLVSAEVQILHGPAHQLSDRLSQLLGGGAAYEVPAVEDPVDRQVRKQGEGERDGQRTVNLVGSLADAELVGEQQVLVAQEAVACSQTGLEGGLDRGRVDRDDRDPTVGDFSGLMELDQFPQLDLSLGSPGPAIEGENERAGVGHLFD